MNLIHMLWAALIVFKSPDKYIQQKWSLLISKSVSCGRAV